MLRGTTSLFFLVLFLSSGNCMNFQGCGWGHSRASTGAAPSQLLAKGIIPGWVKSKLQDGPGTRYKRKQPPCRCCFIRTDEMASSYTPKSLKCSQKCQSPIDNCRFKPKIKDWSIVKEKWQLQLPLFLQAGLSCREWRQKLEGVILSLVPGKAKAALWGGLLTPIFGPFEFLELLKLWP